MSGTARWSGWLTESWYQGRSKTRLSPPPPAPCTPYGSSFQTVSDARWFALFSVRRVPPTAVTHGDDAANDIDGPCSDLPHVVEPESPAEMKIDVPASEPIPITRVMAAMRSGTPVSSSAHWPYEIDATSGVRTGLPRTRDIASSHD